MTVDDRLNQLKPLLSEALTVLDRHTFQLKQINGAVSQLSTVISKQGDNISFLLREQLVMKGDIAGIKGDITGMKGDISGMKGDISGMKGDISGMKGDIVGMKGNITGMKGDITGMKGDIAGMKGDIVEMKGQQDGMNNKLDHIIQLLQKPGQ